MTGSAENPGWWARLVEWWNRPGAHYDYTDAEEDMEKFWQTAERRRLRAEIRHLAGRMDRDELYECREMMQAILAERVKTR